ncbi:MAG: flagellar protein FlaG [Desulfarculales bacterium]|jgi:uncharacterized FlaG/YvyC family protein|nr:flagellar protein FlaG [Desulfarculales bacterium]
MEKVSAVNYQSPDVSGNSRGSASVVEHQPDQETLAAPSRQENDLNARIVRDADLDKVVESLQIDYNINVELAADNTGRLFVRIMSSDGKRILRQMPPDTLIKLHANIKNNRGFLADWLA